MPVRDYWTDNEHEEHVDVSQADLLSCKARTSTLCMFLPPFPHFSETQVHDSQLDARIWYMADHLMGDTRDVEDCPCC